LLLNISIASSTDCHLCARPPGDVARAQLDHGERRLAARWPARSMWAIYPLVPEVAASLAADTMSTMVCM